MSHQLLEMLVTVGIGYSFRAHVLIHVHVDRHKTCFKVPLRCRHKHTVALRSTSRPHAMGVHTITHPPRDRSHTNILYPPCLPYILGAASPIFQQVQAPARGAGAGGPAVPPITTVEIGTDLLDGTNLIAWRADLQPGAPQLSAEVGGRAAVPTQPHMPTTLVVLNPGDREMPSPDAISDKEIRASPRPSFLGLAPDRTPAGAAPPPSQPAIANGTPPPGNTSSWAVADL